MEAFVEYIVLDSFFGPNLPINIVVNKMSNLPENNGGGEGEGGGDPTPPPDSIPNALLLDGDYFLNMGTDHYLALT